MKRWSMLLGLVGIAAFIGCGGGGSDNGDFFSDASFDGIWMLWSDSGAELGVDQINNYVEADGAGTMYMTDGQMLSYSVASNGNFTAVGEEGTPGEWTLSGRLTSPTAGYIDDIDGTPLDPAAPIMLVTNLSALEGDLTGTITEDCTFPAYPDLCDDTVYTLSFTVDADGGVTSGTLTGGGGSFSVTGDGAYTEDGKVVMSLITDAPLNYDWIMVAGTITGVNLTGVFRPDYGGESPTGTVALTFTPAP